MGIQAAIALPEQQGPPCSQGRQGGSYLKICLGMDVTQIPQGAWTDVAHTGKTEVPLAQKHSHEDSFNVPSFSTQLSFPLPAVPLTLLLLLLPLLAPLSFTYAAASESSASRNGHD